MKCFTKEKFDSENLGVWMKFGHHNLCYKRHPIVLCMDLCLAILYTDSIPQPGLDNWQVHTCVTSSVCIVASLPLVSIVASLSLGRTV